LKGVIIPADQARPAQRRPEATVQKRIGVLYQERSQMFLLQDQWINAVRIEVAPGKAIRPGREDRIGLEIDGKAVPAKLKKTTSLR
jgi:hypothetical protein